jgi:hypothetical protein
MLDGFGAFANLGDYGRGGLYDVSLPDPVLWLHNALEF